MVWLKNVFKMIGIWLLILIVCLGVLEVVYRLMYGDPDPLAKVTQKRQDSLFIPDASLHCLSSIRGEFDYTARINHFGYRGKDFTMPKSEGFIRVFAVGDSFTFGVGAEDNQTIPALLEAGLQAQGLPVEVVNAGVGGSSPITHLFNLKNIHLRYQPDLVVLFFDLTDLWDDWYGERHAIRDASGHVLRFDTMFLNGKRDWWITATHYSAFCRYFHNKVIRSFQKMQVLGVDGYIKTVISAKRAKAVIANADNDRAKKASIEYDGLLLMRGRAREAMIREHWLRTTRYLTEIRDLLAAKGIPLILVMYPHGIYIDGDQWAKGRVTWGFEAGKRYDDYFPFELMQEYASEKHIPFINTLDAFLKAPKEKYFFAWDGHMTPSGNRIVASTVAENPDLRQLLDGILARQQKR